MRYFLRVLPLFFFYWFFTDILVAKTVKIRYRQAYGQRYVYVRDVAAFYGMKLRIMRKSSVLYSKYSKLIFTYNKRESMINGVKVHLNFAPFLDGWNAFISEKDFFDIVEPVLRYNSLKKQRVKVIMIDPGHGGKDSGAVGRLFKEKRLVLDIAQRLKFYLSRMGYRVIITRGSDYFLTLAQRSKLCLRNRADLFISIHCNSAATGSGAAGIETYCLTPSGAASTTESKPMIHHSPGNKFSKNNFKLAYEVQKKLIQQTGAVDRGVKHARFYVLKEATCPAILIETGFLSNRKEERRLGLVSYQDRIARAIVAGIRKYHRDVHKVNHK